MKLDKIIERIRNSDTTFKNLDRKMIKLSEEVGELAEAYLGITSDWNFKNKTEDDFKEEAVDVLLVIFDILLTQTPLEKTLSNYEIDDKILKIIDKKMKKWEKRAIKTKGQHI